MSAIDLETFVHHLADESAKAILPFFRTRLSAQDKSAGGRFDPVTEADKAAEVVIRHHIAAQFPGHGIEGEEFGIERPDAEYRWVIDPIDGTRAFLAGLPVWGTLIGLLRNGRAAMGIMHQPFTQERFWGDGAKAQWRGPTGERRLHVRACATLADAVISTTSPRILSEDGRARFDAIEGEAKFARYGLDCYAYAMVAAGQIDLVIEEGLKPYDIAGLIPVIEGAGGVVTTWDGGPAAEGGRIVASGDARLHDAMLRRLTA